MKLRIKSFLALACGLGVCLAHAGEVHYESGHFYIFDFGDGTGVHCHTYQFRGSFEGSVHRYSAEGSCSVSAEAVDRYPNLPPVDPTRIHTNPVFQFAGQFDARTGRTTELMKFPVRQTDKYRTATVVELEMRCPIDPWLGPPGDWFFFPDQWWRQNSCTIVRLETRGNLLSARGVSELMRRGFVDSNPRRPFTAGTLFGDTIMKLREALAQSEQAARATAITNATTGSLRDASPARQGSYNPAGSLHEASPTRQGSAVSGATGTLRDAAPTRAGVGVTGTILQGGAPSTPLSTPAAAPVPTSPPPAPASPLAGTTSLRDASLASNTAASAPPAAAPAARAAPNASSAPTAMTSHVVSAPANAASGRSSAGPRGKAWERQAGDAQRRGLNPQPLPPRDVTAPASTFQR